MSFSFLYGFLEFVHRLKLDSHYCSDHQMLTLWVLRCWLLMLSCDSVSFFPLSSCVFYEIIIIQATNRQYDICLVIGCKKSFQCVVGEIVEGFFFLCQPAEMCNNFPRKNACLLRLLLMIHLAVSWRVNNKHWFMFWWKCLTNILYGRNFLAEESSRGANFIFKDITRLNWQFANCSILNQCDVLMRYKLSSWDWVIKLP